MAKNKERTEKMRTYQKEYHKKNRDKIRERKRLNYAKNPIRKTNRSLKLNPTDKKIRIRAREYARKFKMNKCGICKTKDNLERHHWNYNKPYKNNFNTLCKTCHAIQHIKHFEGGS